MFAAIALTLLGQRRAFKNSLSSSARGFLGES